jgi:nitrogen regulatory protein PII
VEIVKEIEILSNSLELQNVLKKLDNAGVSGYTIIQHVIGKGNRGNVIDDLEGHGLTNGSIMTTCSEEPEHQVVEGIRPILKRFGGVCVVSDAKSIIH